MTEEYLNACPGEFFVLGPKAKEKCDEYYWVVPFEKHPMFDSRHDEKIKAFQWAKQLEKEKGLKNIKVLCSCGKELSKETMSHDL